MTSSTTDIVPIKIEKTTHSKIGEVDFDNLTFGKHFTDHIFIMQYKKGEWGEPKILPFQNISFNPAMAALHYGQSVFEGLKAYRNEDGQIALFRPMDNIRRLNVSAERLCMPQVPEDIFLEALKQLTLVDQDWVPNAYGHSLYLRPVLFGSEALLGVRPAEEYTFIIIASPAAAYYAEPVKVLIETNYTRAARGGVGYAKAAGNYGAALYPSMLAKKKGYAQLLWTDAAEHKYFEEAGTMNVMFIIDGKILTAPTGETILKGITRDSVLTLARDMGIPVEERRVSVEEVIKAAENGTLEDAFGVGTAAAIAHFSAIGYNGKDYYLSALEERTISLGLKNALMNIRAGRTADLHNWMLQIN